MASLIVKIYRRIEELKRVDVHPAAQKESTKLKDEVEEQTRINTYRKVIKKKI